MSRVHPSDAYGSPGMPRHGSGHHESGMQHHGHAQHSSHPHPQGHQAPPQQHYPHQAPPQQAPLRPQGSQMSRLMSANINPFATHVRGRQAPIPNDFEVRYTRRGQPFLVRKSTSYAIAENEAANEHKVTHLKFSSTMEEIGLEFGVGIQLYFDFEKFLMGTNAVLLVIALVPSVWNWARLLKTDNWYATLFSAQYDPAVQKLWFACMLMSVLVWFLFGPFYGRHLITFFRKLEQEDYEDKFGTHYDRIEENRHVSSSQKVWRRFVSYFVFLFLIGVSAVCTFALTVAKSNAQVFSATKNEQTDGTIYSLIIALVTFIINRIFTKLCISLTEFEKHLSWSGFRKHNTLKLFFFKTLNVMILYISQYITLHRFIVVGRPIEDLRCPFETNGEQFLFLILFDVVVSNILELFLDKVVRCCGCNNSAKSEKSDEEMKPEFDLADQYLELLYRQFVLCLGMLTFPMITGIALLGNVLEYNIDKYRLLFVCQRPKRTDSSLKTFLQFFLFITAFMAVFAFPFGAMWVLGAPYFNISSIDKCRLWSHTQPGHAV